VEIPPVPSVEPQPRQRKRAVRSATRKASPFVIGPGDGIAVPLARLGAVQKVCAHMTEGHLAILEHTLPPRHLSAPLHRHSREDELSFVVAGTMGVMLGSEVVTAGAGTYVLKPRGQWHTFWNAGDSELRSIELIMPAGLEDCFERLAPMLSGAAPPGREAILRVAAEYGIEFDFASVGRICRRFGLSPW
jgi:mannose-6-phosphate isomerase-like protein (cupin superfamily)